MHNYLSRLAVGLFITISIHTNTYAYPISYYKAGVYDFSQYLDPNWHPFYCGPTAATNSLSWFADHGYPNLEKGTWNMINTLADDDHMKTASRNGTDPNDFANGLRKYFNDIYPGRFKVDMRNQFSLRWIFDELSRSEDVIFDLAILDNNLKFKYSHYVTLVGYGKDKNGNLNSKYLTIHDPQKDKDAGGDDYYETYIERNTPITFPGPDLTPGTADDVKKTANWLSFQYSATEKAKLAVVFAASPVPEPSTLFLFFSGGVGTLWVRSKRKTERRSGKKGG